MRHFIPWAWHKAIIKRLGDDDTSFFASIWRQRELTRKLGQVECHGDHAVVTTFERPDGRYEFAPCPECGACL